MDQRTVLGANTAVQFIEQINLSTKLGRRFNTFTIRLLLLFSFFGVFWLFLLLFLLLFQLFFSVATIRLISRLKRVFKPTGNTVYHLNESMPIPVYHACIHPEKQIGEDLHSCRRELSVGEVSFVLKPSFLYGFEHLVSVLVLVLVVLWLRAFNIHLVAGLEVLLLLRRLNSMASLLVTFSCRNLLE